jgi:hypothetical protein
MELEPIAYDYEGEYICPLCRESLPETEDATPINSFSWGEVASDTGHGIKCSECEALLLEGWCEAADTGNAGNGFCGECIELGQASLEDMYEDS